MGFDYIDDEKIEEGNQKQIQEDPYTHRFEYGEANLAASGLCAGGCLSATFGFAMVVLGLYLGYQIDAYLPFLGLYIVGGLAFAAGLGMVIYPFTMPTLHARVSITRSGRLSLVVQRFAFVPLLQRPVTILEVPVNQVTNVNCSYTCGKGRMNIKFADGSSVTVAENQSLVLLMEDAEVLETALGIRRV